MNAIKEKLKKRLRYPYYVYREMKKKQEERNVILKDAVKRFDEGTAKHGNLREYKRALYRHRFSYEEYDSYRLWDIDKKKWGEFISLKEVHCIYRKSVQISVGRCFTDKLLGLETFKKYIHRKWVNPKAISFEEFKDFVENRECIAKPRGGTHGNDIFRIRKGDEAHYKELYQFCCENYFLVEEYLQACKEIEEFHPKSLNTVRVVTISNGNNVEIIDAELRMGVHDGVIDNVHQGGIVASIDVGNGMLRREGVDTFGNEYATHPDSGKVIKGFMIPHWEEIVQVCKEAATVVPETNYAGWDICVRQDGRIELIEVNAFPGVIGLQTASQRGLKPRIRDAGKRVLGYDPLKLISVWSKSYVQYDNKYGHYF